MLCHLQLKDPKRYSKTKNKPPQKSCDAIIQQYQEFDIPASSPSSLLCPCHSLTSKGDKDQKNAAAERGGEGRRDGISERETDRGQSRTGPGKPEG